MRRYGRILVAVDGTDSSENAFREACRIARQNKGRVTAITPILPYSDQFEVSHIKKRVGKSLREEGQGILSGIEKIAGEEGVPIVSLLGEGRPSDIIIDAAEEGYDLIVMGRYGSNLIERAFMSSIARRVIGHSDCDVLVVPEGVSVGWKSILLATDGSKCSEATTEKAIDFAKTYGSTLTVLSVVDVNDEFYAQAPDEVERLIEKSKETLAQVKRQAETSNVKTEMFVKDGDAHGKILDLAAEKKTDIIIMGTHGRTGITKFLMGSITKKVIEYTKVPVLVVKSVAVLFN